MRLWEGFIYRFGEGIKSWRIWYAVVFSIVGIVGNGAPIFDAALRHPNQHNLTSLTFILYFVGLLYVLMSVAALPILGWTFYKRIRSNRQQLSVPRQLRHRVSSSFLFTYRAAVIVLFVLVIPAIALSLFGLVGMINYLVSPHFAADQQSVHAAGNYWLGLGMALLACLEEIWRWAMIAAVVYGVRARFRSSWENSISFRRLIFVIAVLVSSFFFGVAHVAEFGATYQGMALVVLGLMGVLLTCVAIATRRLWVAMLVHATYDFLVMTNLAGVAAPWIGIIALLGLIFVVPFVFRNYQAMQHRSNLLNYW